MEAVREKETVPEKDVKPKKKGFMNRLRRSKKKRQQEATPPPEEIVEKVENQEEEEEETRAPSPTELPTEQHPAPVTREGVPVISSAPENNDKFKPSDVRETVTTKMRNGKKIDKKSIVLDAPPAARDSAFSGPPRYDWIDIETAAAVKVQSVYRRNKVLKDLESQGIQTAAMRNKKRRRRARRNNASTTGTEDTPGIFQCCAVGLMFGDATEEDEKARKENERAQYEEKKRVRAEQEAKLRAYKPRAKTNYDLQENFEVVE